METVQERAGDRRIAPVDDEVLTALQRTADTFAELNVIPKKINVEDQNYNWFSNQQGSQRKLRNAVIAEEILQDL